MDVRVAPVGRHDIWNPPVSGQHKRRLVSFISIFGLYWPRYWSLRPTAQPKWKLQNYSAIIREEKIANSRKTNARTWEAKSLQCEIRFASRLTGRFTNRSSFVDDNWMFAHHSVELSSVCLPSACSPASYCKIRSNRFRFSSYSTAIYPADGLYSVVLDGFSLGKNQFSGWSSTQTWHTNRKMRTIIDWMKTNAHLNVL